MPDPAPRFGRYVVLDELVGEAGERTLVAYDPELDRKVGLKLFPVASEGEQARRRERARVLAGLVHSHVVRVHDVGTVQGRLFAAMDFVEGRTLAAWIAGEQRSAARVLEVLRAAGEGLAAAHAAGLVHGRFMAEAVVVGDDGQVRVIDFVRSSPQLGRAPREVDDRMAFCRVAYHALWGHAAGEDAEASAPPTVPRRVRRIVSEGLREDSRRPTMRAVLDGLRPLKWPRLRLGVAALLLMAAVGIAVARPGATPTVEPWCDGLDARLAAVWNPEAIAQGRDAFMATGVPYANEAWSTVELELQLFVDAWLRAQRDHCAATPDEPASLARASTTVCLHRQLQGLEALVAELRSADVELVAGAAEAAAALGSPAACGMGLNDEARYADVDLERVLGVESALSRAGVRRDLGRYRESLEAFESAREQAEALGVRALVAEAHFGRAQVRASLGDEAAAEHDFHVTFDTAVASGHQAIVARSALELAVLLAEQGRHAEAERWAEHAGAAIERHDTLPLRTRLAAVQGLVAYRHGHHEAAKEHYERSIALASQAEPPDDFAKMHASQALGNVLGRLGSTQAEIEILQESLAFAEDKLGPRHPAVGHHLNSLATALARRGSVDLALGSHLRALEIFEDAFGPDHGNTIAARTSLAATLHEQGRDDEAEQAYTTALAAARRSFSVDDPRHVNVLGNVGMFYALTERYVEAAALLAEAATRNEAILGPDHVHTLGFLNNLAATYMFSGNLGEARTVYAELVVRTERALGPDHPQVVPSLMGLARVEHDLGDPAAAVPRLERALQISLDRKERPERVAVVRFSLARALWDAALDRARALTLARAAAQSYVEARNGGWNIGDSLEEVQAWLAERAG